MVVLLRLVLATVFGIAGATKVADQAFARRSLQDFGVPDKLAPSIARLLPPIELAVAGALVVPKLARRGALVAFGLLATFTTGTVITLAHGRRPDCGCFGRRWGSSLGVATIVRNTILALMAVAVGRRS